MALNFSTLVYLPNFDMFSRSITVTPLASQPGLPSYTARGIYDTRPIDVQAEDGSIVSDQQTIVDIRDEEFDPIPEQLDRIYIPPDSDAGNIGVGDYEVVLTESNGGGETTLVIRRVVRRGRRELPISSAAHRVFSRLRRSRRCRAGASSSAICSSTG